MKKEEGAQVVAVTSAAADEAAAGQGAEEEAATAEEQGAEEEAATAEEQGAEEVAATAEEQGAEEVAATAEEQGAEEVAAEKEPAATAAAGSEKVAAASAAAAEAAAACLEAKHDCTRWCWCCTCGCMQAAFTAALLLLLPATCITPLPPAAGAADSGRAAPLTALATHDTSAADTAAAAAFANPSDSIDCPNSRWGLNVPLGGALKGTRLRPDAAAAAAAAEERGGGGQAMSRGGDGQAVAAAHKEARCSCPALPLAGFRRHGSNLGLSPKCCLATTCFSTCALLCC